MACLEWTYGQSVMDKPYILVISLPLFYAVTLSQICGRYVNTSDFQYFENRELTQKRH